MARKPRIEYDGAVFHVVVRGNQRQVVFRGDEDYRKYLEVIDHYRERRGFRVYGYVLMRNHVHLCIGMGTEPLSKIMQGINQRYTMYFNRKYRKEGHLFQGRYKAIVCDADSYLALLVRYLHLNPVRARIVPAPEDYEWSSHRHYLGQIRTRLVDEEPVLRMFSEDKGAARRMYRRFIENGMHGKRDPAFYGTTDGRLLGDEAFVDRVRERVGASKDVLGFRERIPLERLAESVSETTGVAVGELRGRRRQAEIVRARRVFSVAAVESGYSGKEVARFLGQDPASISRKLAAYEEVKSEVNAILGRLEKTNINKARLTPDYADYGEKT